MDRADDNKLRVLFVIGGLGTGGAEKQLIYMLRALRSLGAEVRAITLTEGEYHERSLAALGIQPISAAADSPPVRLAKIVSAARGFRPHFIQATHFFASIYAGAAGRLSGVTSIGAVRGDFAHDLAGAGRAAHWTARLPAVLLANSYNARENALAAGLAPGRVHVLHNVLDVEEFDHLRASLPGVPEIFAAQPDRFRAVTVARLVPVKHLHIFLQALAAARRGWPVLQGVIVGGGSLENELRQQAGQFGLQPDSPDGGVLFMGERSDVPRILSESHLYALTSAREGFPNVLLEAMAASLPIAATPAGETRELVKEGENGFLVPFDDPDSLAECILRLARSADLRGDMGRTGRRMVERQYSFAQLPAALLTAYLGIARQMRDRRALQVLEQAYPGQAGETAISL